MKSVTNKTSLRRWVGTKGWPIPILLLITLVLNILALTLPFLEIHEALKKPIPYKLIHSVNLMWTAKLYLIAILILVFSIIFPFAKLITLFFAWFMPWKSTSRLKYLHAIELLGKWSFMDIFVVILLIALTYKQQWISSTIHIGVYFFVGAISLSMILSEIIVTIAKREAQSEHHRRYVTNYIWLIREYFKVSWVVPVLAILSGVALVQALHANFLQIHQVFFVSRTYSIYNLGEMLTQLHLWVLLCVLVATLGVIPLLRLAILLISWVTPMRMNGHNLMRTVIDSLSRWCMLDVFGLALFLIATEGKSLVKTEVLSGLYVVLVAIGLSYLLGAIAIAVFNSLTNKATLLDEESVDTQ